MATSVTVGPITYNFSADEPSGYYLDGQPWVLAGAQIVSMTPDSQNAGRIINGAEINPLNSSSQGYDSGNSDMAYLDSINVDPGHTGQPISLLSGMRIFKSISKANPGSPARPLITDLAVLTVVSVAPAANSFRPGYAAGTSEISPAIESDIIWANLPSLARTPSTPDIASLTLGLVNDINTNWTDRAVEPENQQPVYGGHLHKHVGDIMCALCCDFTQAEKRELMIKVIQYGIDIHSIITAPGMNGLTGEWDYFKNNGGFNMGRYITMMFAGQMLGKAEYLDQIHAPKFQDIQQTFVVAQDDVDNWGYQASDIGVPEWAVRTNPGQVQKTPNWPENYRDINGRVFVANALVANLMQLTGVDQTLIDYSERYYETEKANGFTLTNKITEFVKELRELYYNQQLPGPANMQTVNGQVNWEGGDYGEENSVAVVDYAIQDTEIFTFDVDGVTRIPSRGVTGLGAIGNVLADGSWSITVDGDHLDIQQMNESELMSIAMTVTNSSNPMITERVEMVIQGADDVPQVAASSVTSVTVQET